jgi:mersacidin/lichenicidin family type 2 lantibiotic
MYDIIRAWKDEDYREEVGADPDAHPAGIIDLAPVRRSAGSAHADGVASAEGFGTTCEISHCADICSATTCFDAVGSVSWDDPALAGV